MEPGGTSALDYRDVLCIVNPSRRCDEPAVKRRLNDYDNRVSETEDQLYYRHFGT